MDNITQNFIAVTANPGSHINDCIKEAVQLSTQEKCNVKLTHNDREYIIDFDKIIADKKAQ